MPGSVSIGSLYGTLSVRDASAEVVAGFKRNLKSAEQQIESFSRAAKSESDRVEASLRKLSASLDPVVAGQQKLDAATKILDASLKRGLITQDEYNQKLAAAKSRYVDNSAAAVRAARGIERAAQRTAREQERASALAERARKREADQAAQSARQIQRENERLTASYNRVVAALDPAAGRAQKYKQTVDVLTKALNSGKISQEEFNRQLGLAKSKYLETSDALDKLNVKAGQMSHLGTTLTAAVTVPIVAIAGGSIKAAKDFESSFAGVDKTVDGVTDSFGNLTAEGAKLQKGLRDLASGPNPIPIDINELNAIAESAGQLGIARDDVLAFTRVMADLGQTTNLTSTDAADAIARFQNIFGSAGKDVDRFGSALVALGNKSASTERDILSMGVRIAAAGNQIGLSQGEVLAYAAALSSVGIEAEAGGSAISKVFIDIALAVAEGGDRLEDFAKVSGRTSEEFAEHFRRDAAGAVETFISSLGKLSGEETLRVLDQMGITEVRMRNALLSAAGAGDLLRRSLDLQAQAWSENTALTAEAEKRYRTFDSQMAIFWGRIKDVGITLGSGLIPALSETLRIATPLIDTVGSLAKWFADLDSVSKGVIITFGGIAASVGPVLFVSGQLIQSWTALVAFSPKIAALAGPWGLIAIAIAGVTTATIILIDKWRKASEQAIELNVRLANLEGSAFRFQRLMRSAGNAVALSTVIQARADAQQLAVDLDKAQRALEKANKERQKAASYVGDWFVPPKIKKRQEDAQAEVNRLTKSYEEQKKALSSINLVYDDVKSELDQIGQQGEETGDILGGLTGEIDKATDAARKALEQSRLERESQAGLLAARRIGIDALRLEETVQQALTKARAAGEKATSAQRLEIIRNSIATSTAAHNLERLETAQKAVEKAFSDNNKEMEKTEKLLREINALVTKLSENAIADSIQINVEQIPQGGQLATETTRERLNTAREWRESWRTAREVANAEIARVGDSLLTLAEKERAITEIRIGLVEYYADAWVSFFNFLGGMFEGVIAEIANAFSKLQSAYQSFSGLGKSMGMDASAASGLGYFGVFVAVVDIAHGLLEAHKENQRNRQWMLSAQALGTRDPYGLGDFQIGAAQDAHLNVSKASRDASKAINDAMEEIATAIGGVLKTFEDIAIQVRRDGKYFQALVGQQVIGIYESFEAAMEAALQASLLAADTIITGLSDLVQQGLSELRSGAIGRTSDLNQVVDFLSALKEISELGLPQGAVQMQELTRHFDDLWRQLQRMNEITPAVAQGFTNLLTAEVSAWEDWRRAITGDQLSPKEELDRRKREAELFNAQKKLRIAELELKVMELKADAERLRVRARVTQAGMGLNQAEVDGWRNHIQAKATFVKAEADITNAYIEFINGVIEAINEVIAAIAAIPDIDVGDIKVPRGAGGGSNRDQVRDFIDDRRYDIESRGMTEHQRALADLERAYAPMLELAGKDVALRNQLLSLKREEIALLEHEQRVRVSGSFQQFVNPDSQFDAVRRTAADLIAEIEASPFGDARKARMIARVLAEVDEQIEALSQREAADLFGSLISDLEKAGATDAQLFEYRQALAILEHTLNVENYRARIAILKAEGIIADEIIAKLEAAFEIVAATDPLKFAKIPSPETSSPFKDAADDVADGLNKLAEAFKRAKDSIRDTLNDLTRGEFGIVDPTSAFEAAKKQYDDVIAKARAGELVGFEQTSEATRNFIEALKIFSPALAAVELPKIQGTLDELLQADTVRDENLIYTEKFANNQDLTNQNLDKLSKQNYMGFKDLSGLGHQQIHVQSNMLSMLEQLKKSNDELNSRLALLETEKLAQKRPA